MIEFPKENLDILESEVNIDEEGNLVVKENEEGE